MSDREIADAAADVDWPLLSLVRTHGDGNHRLLGLGAAASCVSVLLSNADMFVIGLAFDAMFNDQAYALPLVPAGWIPTEPTPQLAFTVALLLGLKVVDMSCGLFAQWSLDLFAQRTLHRIRVDAFDAVQRLDLAAFDAQQTGDLMSVLNNDVNALERFLSHGPNLGVVAVTLFVSSIGYMAVIDWRLALVSVAIAPVIVGLNHWFGVRHESRHDDVRSETGVLNALLETNVSGIGVVKAFGGETHETDRVDDASGDHRTATWRAHMVGVRHQPTLRILAGLAFVVTFFVGTEWVLDGSFGPFAGTLTAGELVPFMYYTQTLAQPVRFAAWVTGLYKGAKAAGKRIVGVQRLETPREDGSESLDAVDGRVTFDDVSFRYAGADEPTLTGVSFAVEPGETVGLVGETGAGKSTLLKLLLAFYDPDEGSVRLDGHGLRDLSRDSLRESIGYVAQDAFLFSGTIRENVAYGVSEADRREVSNGASGEERPASVDGVGGDEGFGTVEDGVGDVDDGDARVDDGDARVDDGDARVDEEDVIAAAKAASAHEFVADLDDGYDAEVGERGVKLSGGQRQRLALARVLLADPPVLVLDEATSHVDNRTELLIQRSLADVTADRTTFVVAHRLSTVRDADRILVVDGGEIVERGSHEELLERDGQYADLWRVQVGAATPSSND